MAHTVGEYITDIRGLLKKGSTFAVCNIVIVASQASVQDVASLNVLCAIAYAARNWAARDRAYGTEVSKRWSLVFLVGVMLACYLVKIIVDEFMSGPQQLTTSIS